MIDIYHTRRGKFKLCEYFVRNEDDRVGDLSVFVLKTKPTGIFYAQEINTRNDQRGQINNVFSYSESFTTLETNDNVMDLKTGDIVKYLGHAWKVLNVQRQAHDKEMEFGINEFTTIISIQR